MRFTDEELALIQATFKGNEKLLKLMRKVFLPEYDPYAPLGQTVDLWMVLDIKGLDPQQAYLRMLSRNELIVHIEQQLLQLKALSLQTNETEKEKDERRKKDSTK